MTSLISKSKELEDTLLLGSLLFVDGALLRWRTRPPDKFPNIRLCNSWNSRCAGKVAGCKRKDGYIVVGVFGVSLLAHRIIFALTYGYFPDTIDHIDRNPSNNHPDNLRDVTMTQNQFNRSLAKNNTSGSTGVTESPCGRWEARLMYKNRNLYVGSYESKAEEILAREKEKDSKFSEEYNASVS